MVHDPGILERRRRHRRAYPPRSDTVDATAGGNLDDLVLQTHREAVHHRCEPSHEISSISTHDVARGLTALARRVVGMPRLPILARRATDQHDRGLALRRGVRALEAVQIRAHDEKRRSQVRRDRRVPLGERHPRNRHVLGRPIAVVDDNNLHRAERSTRVCEQLRHRALLGKIGVDVLNALPELGVQRLEACRARPVVCRDFGSLLYAEL